MQSPPTRITQQSENNIATVKREEGKQRKKRKKHLHSTHQHKHGIDAAKILKCR